MSNSEITKISRRLFNKVNQTCHKQQLINEGDSILVGLSGGKDSLILLEMLSRVQRSARYKFSVQAIHIHISNVGYKVNPQFLEEYCKQLEVPLTIISKEIDFSKKVSKTECFYCSWNRRSIIFGFAEERGCNKLAFGHHLDDAVQTIMLNMIHHGTMSSMPYKLDMFKGKLQLIRPLLDICENDLIEYSKLVQLPVLAAECPYGSDTQRKKMKKIIDEISTLNQYALKNLFRAPTKVFKDYIPGNIEIV